MNNKNALTSKPVLWTGRILKGAAVLFLLFDASMKMIREPHVLKSCAELGIPSGSIQALGLYLLVATTGYAIPRTSFIGAILITAYLGGATAVTFTAKLEGHPYLFPVIFGLIIWIAEFITSSAGQKANPAIRV